MGKSDNDRGIYRSLYVSIWDDPSFLALNSEAKMALVYLRTSPLSNMPCIFRCYKEAIREHTGLSDEAVARALETLCNAGWIKIEGGIVWVRNALKYDPNISLNNSKHVEAVRKILAGLPKLTIVVDFCAYYGIDMPYPIPNREGAPYPMAITEPDPEPEKDKEKEQDKERPVQLHGCPPVVRVPFSEIITYLNAKAGTRFLPSTPETQEKIKARWREGFRLDDFKMVIDTMTAKWKNDPKMRDYLRPMTLFGTKFEGYLNMTVSLSDRGIVSPQGEKGMAIANEWLDEKKRQEESDRA
jgi:uncharacterized phage protein (TIGR02220 family)